MDDPGRHFRDCCLEVIVSDEAVPVLTIGADEVDPFTGEEPGWPAPVVYWSSGTITAGGAV